MRVAVAVALVALLTACAGQARDDILTPGLDTLFDSLDINHDGELTQSEAEQFIRTTIVGDDYEEYDDSREVEAAAKEILSRLDSSDVGATVSAAELDHQLHTVLPGTRVADWVQHGLGLPQYAEQFRHHAVTPLDFPILLADGGKVLAGELQVRKGPGATQHTLSL